MQGGKSPRNEVIEFSTYAQYLKFIWNFWFLVQKMSGMGSDFIDLEFIIRNMKRRFVLIVSKNMTIAISRISHNLNIFKYCSQIAQEIV